MKTSTTIAVTATAVLALSLFGIYKWMGSDTIAESPVGELDRDSSPAPVALADDVELAGSEAVAAKPTPIRKAVEVEPEESDERDAAPQGPWLSGRILDPYGNVLTDARVSVETWRNSAAGMFMGNNSGNSESKRAVTTDQDGRFTISRRKGLGAELSVVVRTRGFLVLREKRRVDEEGDHELGDFHLEPGVIIAGVVVDQKDVPVVGARVRRLGEQSMADVAGVFLEEFGMGGMLGGVKTDESGRFELGFEKPGPVELELTHEDHPDTTYKDETPSAGGELTGLLIRMAPGASIAGVLMDLPEGKDKVHVSARAVDAETDDTTLEFVEMLGDAGRFAGTAKAEVDETGAFLIRGLDPGVSYELLAFEKGSMFDRRPCSLPLVAEAGATDVELPYDPGATLTFKVVDARTDEPLTELNVRHVWQGGMDMFAMMSGMMGGGKTESYPGGDVTIDELRPSENPGMLELAVSAPGFLQTKVTDIEIAEHANVELGLVRLRLAPRVRVQVVESKSGKPIPRARVRLSAGGFEALSQSVSTDGAGVSVSINLDDEDDDEVDFGELADPKSASGKTDSEGWVELSGFEAESATLSVKSTRYASWKKEGIKMKGSGVTDFTAHLVHGGTVQVKVVDTSGQPMGGVIVRHKGPDGSRGSSKKSKKTGIAQFRRLVPGIHKFKAEHERSGFDVSVDLAGDSDEDPWTPISVVDDEESFVTVRAPGLGSLSGVVTSNGKTLRGASVSLMPGDIEDDDMQWVGELGAAFGGGRRDVSDNDGRYEIKSVPEGEYYLVVRHSDHAMATRFEVEVREGETRFDAALSMATIEGVVTDQDGEAVEGARIVVRTSEGDDDWIDMQAIAGPFAGLMGPSDNKTVKTGTDGSYRLEGVQDGVKLYIGVVADGYVAKSSEELTVSEGESRDGVDFELLQGGTIRVTVAGETPGFAMVRANFVGESENPPGSRMTWVNDGKATLTGMQAGEWEVRIDAWGDVEIESETVEVTAGQEVAVTLGG